MIRSPLRLLAALALVALTLFVVACGSSSNSARAERRRQGEQRSTTAGKKGGKLTQLGASDVDFLDPGQTYYTGGYQVLYATMTTLYMPKPDSDVAVPGLADGAPTISDDKKTVTVKLRKGVKFGPPVNREVQAKDVKYAFERAATKNVPNQYTTYFNFIDGWPKKPGALKDIPGIVVDNPYQITFKLASPQAPGFAASLIMPITAPVPKEYAEKYDKANPSTYNEHVVSSGPYMVKNDAQGNLTGYKAGKSIDIVRNPNWNKAADFRPAYLDEINFVSNATDANVAGRQVLAGQNLVLDTNPPAQVLKRVVQRAKDQLVTLPGGGFRWFPLNMSIKPLDNINVRKAILAGVRPHRGHQGARRLVRRHPRHALPAARDARVRRGRRQEGPRLRLPGQPPGRHGRGHEVHEGRRLPVRQVHGQQRAADGHANVDPGKAQAEVAKAQLEKLGFKVRLRTVPQDAVYTEWCQQPKKKIAVCGSAGWFKDFNDPQSMLDPTFKGSNFSPDGGNNNLAQLQDPKIDKAMNDASMLEGKAALPGLGRTSTR